MARKLPAASVISFFEAKESTISEFITEGSDNLGMDNSGDECYSSDEHMETEPSFAVKYTHRYSV